MRHLELLLKLRQGNNNRSLIYKGKGSWLISDDEGNIFHRGRIGGQRNIRILQNKGLLKRVNDEREEFRLTELGRVIELDSTKPLL